MAYEEYTPKEVSSMLGLIDTYMRWNNYTTQNDRQYIHYHPSEFGKCLRAQQYKHYADMGYISVEHASLDSKILRLFDKGHNMHSRWIKYFDEIGKVLMGRWRCKNELCAAFDNQGNLNNLSLDDLKRVYIERKRRIYGNNNPVFKPSQCVCGCKEFDYEETIVESKELNMNGHADMIVNCDDLDIERFKGVDITFDKKFLPINGAKVVGDFKTINSRAWNSQLKANGPHKSYLIQLTIYIYILNCEYGLLMYENKDTSDMRWYMVSRNDKWWELIQKQAKKMIEISSARQLPPPRPLKNDSYECLGCPFREMCKKSGIWQKKGLNEARRKFYGELL